VALRSSIHADGLVKPGGLFMDQNGRLWFSAWPRCQGIGSQALLQLSSLAKVICGISRFSPKEKSSDGFFISGEGQVLVLLMRRCERAALPMVVRARERFPSNDKMCSGGETRDFNFRTVIRFSTVKNPRKIRWVQGKTALALWLLFTTSEPKHDVSAEQESLS